MAEKIHWAQTPEGKAKMAELTKKRWAEGVYKNKVKRSKAGENKKKFNLSNQFKRIAEKREQEKKEEPFIINVNGWRISLSRNGMTLEQENG